MNHVNFPKLGESGVCRDTLSMLKDNILLKFYMRLYFIFNSILIENKNLENAATCTYCILL